MHRIGNLVVGLIVLSALFALIESLFAANTHQPRFRRKGLGTDIVYWFLTPLVTKSISQIGLAIILILSYRRNIADIQRMLIAPDSLLAQQPSWLQAVEMIVVGDLINYWVHRWFHGSLALRPLAPSVRPIQLGLAASTPFVFGLPPDGEVFLLT